MAEGREAFTAVLDDYDYPTGYGWSFGFFTQRSDQDDAVASGDALVYAVAAQDCTPSLSVLMESGRVDVP